MTAKQWFQAFVLMAFGIALGLVVLEFAILRGIFGYYGLEDPTHLFVHDELLGWRFKPGARGFHSHLDFRVDYQINANGLRDREFPYQKRPFRVQCGYPQ